MSEDSLVANLDRREFLSAFDMGINGRSIEHIPCLFHVAMTRLLVDKWIGCRISIITEGGHPCHPNLQLPSWESIMARSHGWKSILAHVIGDLVTRHSGLEEIYHGGNKDLLRGLKAHIRNLHGTLDGLSADSEMFGDDIQTERECVSRELEYAADVLKHLKKSVKSASRVGTRP